MGAKVGREDVVLVDRPGRGYGADYSPWLVDGPRRRARPVTRTRRHGGGDPRCPDDCLFCRLVREGDHVAKTDGFVAIRDINPQAETHLLVIPERHVDTFRDISEFPADEAKRMLDFVAEVARDAGLEDYRVLVNVGPGGGQTDLPPTLAHSGWEDRRDAGLRGTR